eukprot:TRINITY_DN13082_c0_g3_i1.p1 TRINITY_DN13082_c0_g3~~TRINITY_DN13082_c0_g3_i1.p1  ORF type:complete len:282 (+),score=48.49 TRINITY_DN13082_c0_g3_i1:88-846(+)
MATPGETEPIMSSPGLRGIESTAVRHGFVQKVYGILGFQLLLTTAIGGTVMVSAKQLSRENPSLCMGLLVMSSVMTLAMMFVFMCCPSTMRNSPTNYILLTLFTIAEAVLVGFISAQYTKESVLMVLAVTTLVVLALTLFACQTKYDITGLMPYFVVASMVMCGFGLVLWIASLFGAAGSPAFHGLRLVYAVCGALLFSGFIVFDTQMIVGGKHAKYSFSIDDYCMAAINLYLDIIQLFLFLLEIFGDRRNN